MKIIPFNKCLGLLFGFYVVIRRLRYRGRYKNNQSKIEEYYT